MSENSIPEVDPAIPPRNAVSVYSQDAMDDFPVLKAFQQYIDAEQAKARKRLSKWFDEDEISEIGNLFEGE